MNQEEKEHPSVDDDLPLRIPLPPSPDISVQESSTPPPSLPLHARPATPFAPSAPPADEPRHDDGPTIEVKLEESEPAIPSASCTCAERLCVLENELEETKRAIAQRDEEMVDLRRAVNQLRMATLGR